MEATDEYALHGALPRALTKEALASWIVNNSKEEHSESKRYYFTEEETIEHQKRSSDCGREILRLEALKATIRELITKGNHEEDLMITIPSTNGLTALKKVRQMHDEKLDKGYEEEHINIYGIPDVDQATMEFFDAEGNHFPDRSRDLSTREKHAYIGLFISEPTERQQVV